MPSNLRLSAFVLCLIAATAAGAQEKLATQVALPITFGPYEYEAKPDDPAFTKFNPRKAPQPGTLLLRKGDRLAIIGDSITEQKMYSRLIETYLTVCWPELQITARQYGWSGEKADGFLRRMDQDCLRFEPTIATLCYGMNDAKYRPFETTQIKRVFHGKEGKADIEAAVRRTEAERKPLADAIRDAIKPVQHTIGVQAIE